MRFEDDSVESAKIVKQWNVKIISVSTLPLWLDLLCRVARAPSTFTLSLPLQLPFAI
jgi:hypothetical protein